MKKIGLTLLIFFNVIGDNNANNIFYTIIAKSGLSLRADRSIDSDRLAVVEFGEYVKIDQIHREDKIKVEGIHGFWIEVTYNHSRENEMTGFMFSGFLYPGKVSFKKQDIELEEFLIIDELDKNEYESFENGNYNKLSFYNFDPLRKWYGVKVLKEKTLIQKVKLELEINYAKIQELHENENLLNAIEITSFMKLKSNTKEIYNFFLGTNLEIPSEIPSTIHSESRTSNALGTFLKPLWEAEFNSTRNYLLRASTRHDSTNNKNYYELKVINQKSRKGNRVCKNEYRFNSPISQHNEFKYPRIIWSGDLNGDEVPELIFLVHILEIKCGQPWISFFTSEIKNGKIEYKKLHACINLNSF